MRYLLVASTLGDRKSTRLNSSHLVISYAVFRLKKRISGRRSLPHRPLPARPLGSGRCSARARQTSGRRMLGAPPRHPRADPACAFVFFLSGGPPPSSAFFPPTPSSD